LPFPNTLKVELSPRRIEEELKAYLNRWFEQTARTHIYKINPMAVEALEHVVSRAFLSGKIAAARETNTPWQIVGDDSEVIQQTSEQFVKDLEKIMHDLRLDVIVDGPPISRIKTERRFDALAQVLTWKAYRLGKKSEYTRSPSNIVFMAQHYKYEGYYALIVRMDEKTCQTCIEASQFARMIMTQDYNTFANAINWTDEGYHINCRCEPVVTPTVKILKKQDRFRESFFEESLQWQEVPAT